MANPARVPGEMLGESPFGPIATNLGFAALNAYNRLDPIREWRGSTTRHWLLSDYLEFDAVLDVAYWTDEKVQGSLELRDDESNTSSREGGMALNDHLNGLHTALPFTEAERHWLVFTAYITGGGEDHQFLEDTARFIRARTSGPRYDAGRMKEIRGRDLLNSWWAWRRDILEFEDQGGIDTARDSLRGIVDILLPTRQCEPIQGTRLAKDRETGARMQTSGRKGQRTIRDKPQM
jgi:hypothetical protein